MPADRRDHARQCVAVTVAAVTIAASLSGWSPTHAMTVAIVVAASTVGMPHGAFDIVLGPARLGATRFGAVYAAAAGATLVVWFVAPVVALFGFLAMSWFHFATGDAVHHRRLGVHAWRVGVATAGSVIGVPLALHSASVVPVVDDLVGPGAISATTLRWIGTLVCAVAAVTVLPAIRIALRDRIASPIVEISVIAAVAVLVDPLVAFSIYFALWHSPRHLFTIRLHEHRWWPVAGATIATLATGFAGWLVFEPSTAGATRIVFAGLSALTTPHLVVTAMVARTARLGGSAGSRSADRDVPVPVRQGRRPVVAGVG